MTAVTENSLNNNPLPMKAGGTVAANRLVKMDSVANQFVAATAEGDLVIGVCPKAVVAGDSVGILTGTQKVRITSGAAVAVGAEIEPTTGGKGITAAGAAARSSGVALTASTADEEEIEVLINLPNVKGPANS